MSGRVGALTAVALRAPSVSAPEELSTLLKTGTFYFALTGVSGQDDGIAVPRTCVRGTETKHRDAHRSRSRPRQDQGPEALDRYRRLAKGDRITHRIPITSLEEIDDEVRRWLKTAYELDA